MEIKKNNDILVATLNNPGATPEDLMSLNLTPDNTSLYTKEQYKESNFIKQAFRDENGNFDDLAFDDFYKIASNHYKEISDNQYLDNLNKVIYSPFDVTRPKDSKTFSVNVEFAKDYNPFRQSYSRTAINSIDDNLLSLRELAQQSKVFDPTTNTWSEESANDLGLLNKFFGDTLVYAQWDEDGTHKDPQSGRIVSHNKGDWKINDDGNLFIEKLGQREIYGKQVVNPTDMLTTDGTLANRFDFFDSDSREKSIGKVATKVVFDIAPYLIPGVGQWYGGIKAAISLASVLPTFYKSMEGLVLGDNLSDLGEGATAAENYLAKFTQRSVSDESQSSLFSFEQMSQLVGDVFSQIYEQRAAASLAMLIKKPTINRLQGKAKELEQKIVLELSENLRKGEITVEEFGDAYKIAASKIPELKIALDSQSKLSKSLALGYMALTSTADIYGEALNSGYDRRTAGFAALASAAGQYGIMMNNRMGDWFLDKTTGYTLETNKALMRKSVLPWLEDVSNSLKTYGKNTNIGKVKLSESIGKIKGSISEIFLSPSELGEAMWKNALVEGVEEVTEQVVQDATKGMIDVMSYLGMTKKQGSFGGFENVFSQSGLENYIANFVGGILGGAMFEFNTKRIEPFLSGKGLSQDTKESLYSLIANGHKEDIIQIIKSNKKSFGNNYIGKVQDDGTYGLVEDGTDISQADLIEREAINLINHVDNLINSQDLGHTDEEVVKKAIRDAIIIKSLNASKGEKQVGIEGLILSDYLDNMTKINTLTEKINSFSDSEVNKEIVSRLTEERNIYKDNVNNILEGNYAEKYFKQILFYLTKNISENWVTIDKDTYSLNKYKKSYIDLHDSGEGLTKERVDKEFQNYIDSRDIKKDLEVATNAYFDLALKTSPSIESFTTTGYNIERNKTYKNIIRLKETIDLFNTTTDKNKKASLLKHFVDINNELESQGFSKVSPWDVYNTDIYEQLKSLGLVKKINYSNDVDGNIQKNVEDFSNEELSSTNINGISTDQINKQIISDYFMKFPINPLNAESIINSFNKNVEQHNSSIYSKLVNLESKETKTEEDFKNIEDLKASLINIEISDFENTAQIKTLVNDANDSLETFISNNDIDRKAFNDYEDKVKGKTIKSFDQVLSDSNIEGSLEDWSKDQKIEFLTFLLNSGYLNNYVLEMSKTSDNIAEYISSAVDGQLSDEQFNLLFDEVVKYISSELNYLYNLSNNDLYKEASNKREDIINDLNRNKEKLKPELLKINNYGLDLIIKELQSGNGDRELFEEAKKLIQIEYDSVKNGLLKDIKKVSNEEILFIVDNWIEFVDVLSDQLNMAQQMDDEITIENAILELEGSYPELANILRNNFDTSDVLSFNTIGIFSKIGGEVKLYKNSLGKISNFNKMDVTGMNLKVNTLYDFIRNFQVSLDSSNSKEVGKIFDILEKEENSIKAASSITNYTTSSTRAANIDQAINTLKLLKSVVSGMASTELSYGDPYGFFTSLQNFVKRNSIESELSNLKSVTSDVASLMQNDLDKIIVKLQFVKDLSKNNSLRIMNEQEIIRSQMSKILLNKWKNNLTIYPTLFPVDKITKIFSLKESDEFKLNQIENEVYEFCKDKKEDVLIDILKKLEYIDSSDYSSITRDITEVDLKNYDLAVYYATVLAYKSQDFNIRTLTTINGDFNKAPFYTQEFALRILKAATINPQLFAKIIELKGDSSNLNGDFLTVLLGVAGSGKTSTVFGSFLDNLRQTNNNINVWLSAPHEDQVNKLELEITSSIGSNGLDITKHSLKNLFNKLGLTELTNSLRKEGKNVYDSKNSLIKVVENELELLLPEGWIDNVNFDILPNLLLIDECTHYSWAELHILNEISKESYKRNDVNFMKVVVAGDDSQLGYELTAKIENGDRYYSRNVSGINSIFTPRLSSTVRATNDTKKDNNDLLVGLLKFSKDYYKDITTVSQLDKANTDYSNFLKNIDTITALGYYHDDKIMNGDIILQNYDEKVFKTLSNIIKESPEKTIGILTENGVLNEELSNILSKYGLILPDSSTVPNLKIYSKDNVQGSEADYFIFDIDNLTNYDRTHKTLRAFYTYMSRAKDGSIILDKNNFLSDHFGISNERTAFTEWREPLSKEVIKNSKEQRIDSLNLIIGQNTSVTDDNFKFEQYGGTTEEVVTIQDVRTSPTGSYIDPWQTDKIVKELSPKEKQLKQDFPEGNYEFMLHSFYNNLNARISENGIVIDRNLMNSDLNFPFDFEGDTFEYKIGKKELNDIIKQWAALKNYLLENKDVSIISSNKYKDFLSKVFSLEGIDQNISVSLVMTGVKYNSTYNSPYKKYNDDITRHLKNGSPFINLSAKLKFGGAEHYITLATFGSKETILENIERVYGNSSKMYSDFIKKYTSIEEFLNTNELWEEQISVDKVSTITSTRLVKPTVASKFYLDKLSEDFPGMNISEVRIFPPDEDSFRELLNRYTFGDPRNEEQITRLVNPTKELKEIFESYNFEDENFKKDLINSVGNRLRLVFLLKDYSFSDRNVETKVKEILSRPDLRNTPYIVVSYGNDLNGGNKNVLSKLIPISADYRDLQSLIKEVKDFKSKVASEVKGSYNDSNKKVIISDKTNAIADTMLSQSQILDILIKWADTTLDDKRSFIDLLVKEYSLVSENPIFGKKITMLDVIADFRDSTQNTTEKLKEVIKLIKSAHYKYKDTLKGKDLYSKIKYDIIHEVRNKKGWGWDFYNIFDAEGILKRKKEKDYNSLIQGGVIAEDQILEGYEAVNADVATLLRTLADINFYYSIPIKTKSKTNKTLIVNEYISGANDSILHDKLYINVIPESQRLLVNLQEAITSGEITSPKQSKKIIEAPTLKTNDYTDNFSALGNIPEFEGFHKTLLEVHNILEVSKQHDFTTFINNIIEEEFSIKNIDPKFRWESMKVKILQGFDANQSFGKWFKFLKNLGISDTSVVKRLAEELNKDIC